MFWFLLIFGLICYTDTLPRQPTRGRKIPRVTPATTPATTPFNYGYDPIVGVLTPSRDIEDFVASVFGPRQGDVLPEEITDPTPTDSGELLKPNNTYNNAHIGFEQYWPGGDWVFRKAEIDRCNNSDTACSKVFGKYGKVCAGNHDLTVHTTFDTICDMYDANCRDGTYTAFTTTGNDRVVWMPVGPNGFLDFKVATGITQNEAGFILARTRSIHAKPRWSFAYGRWCGNGYHCIYINDNNRWTFWGDLRDKKVRHFRVQWNESTGGVSCNYLKDGKIGYWNAKRTFGDPSTTFAAHYFGLWGGTPEEPTWWEITGYMLAYRGKCRADLPTLPTEMPVSLGRNVDIELYNFAERMDEFGYNYSRLPTTDDDHYMGDEDLSDTNMYGKVSVK